jgi:hypothetical protein
VRRIITKEISLAMHELYDQGLSLADAAARFEFKASSALYAFRRFGLPTRNAKLAGAISAKKRSGELHWARRNQRPINSRAYRSRRIVDEDGNTHKRRVHVIEMEKLIGRRLTKSECVHHVNGDRHDNRIENLKLMTKSEHAKLEALSARKHRPHVFIRVRGEKGRYVPEPTLPWSAYNPNGLMPKSLRKVQ